MKRYELTEPCDELPFKDDELDRVYATCLDQCPDVGRVLNEICRACKVGATVEVLTPHWNSPLASAPGRLHAISEQLVRHWTRDFIGQWFDGPKNLVLKETQYKQGEQFGECRGLCPGWTDEQVMRLMPGACHEVQYTFEVRAKGGQW